jgi:hypothetical protein
MEEVKRLLAPLLRAGVPTLAVLGNHDYGQDDTDEPGPRRWTAGSTRATARRGTGCT